MSQKRSEYDVVIAGGGPAGLSALLWCSDLGLDAVLLETQSEIGGQMLRIHNAIRNYLGIETANGRQLRDAFLSQIETMDLRLRTDAEIVKADLDVKCLTLSDGSEYLGRALVIATGVRRRKLNVPGEGEFWGKGILESGIKSRDEVKGKDVVIVGGGDAALENAIFLSETARKIMIVHRRSEFTARGEFIGRATGCKNIKFIFNARVSEIIGNTGVENVEILHLTTKGRSHVAADAVLIRIGVEPNTGLFRGQIDLDDAGYVKIGANCETSLPCVYAVGDVANPVSPTISVAAGNGSSAAKAIFEELR